MALHGIDQPSDYLAEPFSADSIGCFPNDRQRLSNRLVVDPRPFVAVQELPAPGLSSALGSHACDEIPSP
jgi:hypothetical protein